MPSPTIASRITSSGTSTTKPLNPALAAAAGRPAPFKARERHSSPQRNTRRILCARRARPRGLPPPPFSTTTPSAMRGASAGANATNKPWSRRRSSMSSSRYFSSCAIVMTCAVPVLPATLYARALASRATRGAARLGRHADHRVVHELPMLRSVVVDARQRDRLGPAHLARHGVLGADQETRREARASRRERRARAARAESASRACSPARCR